jgi:hypothetical protein
MIHPIPTSRALLVPVCLMMAIIGAIGLQAAEPIVVIASFNMTGPEAVLDAACYRGAELAVENSTPPVAYWADRFN